MQETLLWVPKTVLTAVLGGRHYSVVTAQSFAKNGADGIVYLIKGKHLKRSVEKHISE